VNSSVYKILLIEGNQKFANKVISKISGHDFTINHCCNEIEAQHFLDKQKYDLLITELKTSANNNADFFDFIKQNHPNLKRIVLTSENTDEFMELISQYNIGLVLNKKEPDVFYKLKSVIKQIRAPMAFRLSIYLNPHSKIETVKVKTSKQIEAISKEISKLYSNHQNEKNMLTMLQELLTNAVFYGARRESAEDKSLWDHNFILDDSECIIFSHGKDEEKIVFSIMDQGGHLDKKTVLYWLNRQTTLDKNGLPKGIMDSHGRGIYIARKITDILIINIAPGEKSECVVINWLDQTKSCNNKPLLINEHKQKNPLK
ncbi:MAG: hypothetical protein GX801_11685, partial [Fibrobacter sp.]|nr:hypothetical protein [Fibrobacter sp.]